MSTDSNHPENVKNNNNNNEIVPVPKQNLTPKSPLKILSRNQPEEKKKLSFQEKIKLKLANIFPCFREDDWKPKNCWEKIFYNGSL